MINRDPYDTSYVTDKLTDIKVVFSVLLQPLDLCPSMLGCHAFAMLPLQRLHFDPDPDARQPDPALAVAWKSAGYLR